MRIVTKPVRTVMQHMMCDCGGEMESTGITLTSYPEQYPHVCSRCGAKENLFSLYPSTAFEEIDK